MSRNYMDMQLKKATSHLAKLVHKGSFLRGNIVIMKRTCGYPKCKCVLEGKKHESMYIGKKQEGTTKMIYVPRRLEEEVEKKIDAYHRIKKLVDKISELNYRELKEKKDKKVV